MRAAQWKASLPADIDEWAEAVPFKETRGYVQGVVRNRLQYLRLYDEKGNFRPEVGARAAAAEHGSIAGCQQAASGFFSSLGDVLNQPSIDCTRTATTSPSWSATACS